MRLLLVCLIALLGIGLSLVLGEAESEPGVAAQDRVARGRYLVKSIGCADCHSPWVMGPNGPHPDPDRDLSGHPADLVIEAPLALGEGPWGLAASRTMTAWSGPWGVSFTRNLTPDPETGLGEWSEDEFVATLRNMRHRGIGRPLLPPMPPMYGQNLTDEDLKSIYAYLRTIPPVKNRVPTPLPPR